MNIITNNKIQVLEIKTTKGLKYISLNKIVYIKAENRGTTIFMEDSEKIFTKHLIKQFEKFLIEPEFFRCHNSYLVNCRYVDCLCSHDIILKNNDRISLSRNKKHNGMHLDTKEDDTECNRERDGELFPDGGPCKLKAKP